MTFKRILVAVNSPDGRDAAFERGLALAKSAGAELYLLHAVPVSQAFSFRGGDRLERMAGLRTRAEDSGVRVQTVEQHGDAADIIELHANAREADLIVMGGEARRGWGRRSWVAEKVIRRTKVPTLVVPSDAPDTSTVFGNVLVAIDLSPASEDVLRGALGLTVRQTSRLTVMHTFWRTRGDPWKGLSREFLRVWIHTCRCRRGPQLAQFSNTPPTQTQISSSWDGAEASSCWDRRPCASFVRTTARCW